MGVSLLQLFNKNYKNKKIMKKLFAFAIAVVFLGSVTLSSFAQDPKTTKAKETKTEKKEEKKETKDAPKEVKKDVKKDTKKVEKKETKTEKKEEKKSNDAK